MNRNPDTKPNRRKVLQAISTLGLSGAGVLGLSGSAAASHLSGSIATKDEVIAGEEVSVSYGLAISDDCRESLDDAGIVEISIDWGDGTSVTGRHPPSPIDIDNSHTYTHPGEYTISLGGCAICDFDNDGEGEEECHEVLDTTQITVLPEDPTEKDHCMHGRWEDYGFRNQGQCIRFVETGKDSR